MARFGFGATGDDRGPRLAAVDAIRGIALLAMVVYHLAWDLADFQLVGWDVAAGPIWRLFARSIATSFLILVGVSLVLATRNGFKPRPFLRRLAIIVIAAALVSFGTWWFAADAFAFFGILHMIAVGSVLALPFLLLPSWLVAIAAVAVFLAPYFLANPIFDAPWLWWLGLVTETPRSVDYVPVFPWFAPILVGIVAGRLLLRYGAGSAFARWQPADGAGRALVTAGLWSLPVYVVHQPILIGLLSLIAPLVPPNPAVEATIFKRECAAACDAQGRPGGFCTAFCSCTYAGIGGTDLMAASRSAMTADQTARWNAIIGQCRGDSAPPFQDEAAPAPAP
jgi:uncharacterized membrane protein